MKGLHIENMKRVFDGFTLGPVNMDIGAGYIVAVIGKNGCGKSTFFNCLLGTERYSGECRWDIDGKSNADNSVLSEKFAYILERCPFPKEYTPREIEKCFADFYETFDRKRYYEILSRYNIPLNKQLFKLSRGNIIVVQIAFAFSYKSEVLFLDEPSAHLDSYARNELYEELAVRVFGIYALKL